MARSARVQFPGAIYHISARGNHQENIYFSDQDRELFIRLLAAAAKRMHWICHAYCLMTNHYHLPGIVQASLRGVAIYSPTTV
ncbi:hypothetical protein MUP29_01610 [bacterium]|nr:hypothetical protein [bacterium]